jgi:hypothetical protein
MKTSAFHIALVAGLVAGTVSTASAGGGFKFGGNGNNSGSNRSAISRSFNPSARINIGGGSNHNGSQNLGSIQKFKPQIKINGQGAVSGIQHNHSGNTVGRLPGVKIQHPLVGVTNKTPTIKIDPKFGQDKKLGIQIGKPGGVSIGNGGIVIGKHGGNAAAHSLPGDKHCHKNLLNWCDPHHWPCYKPCYPCHKPICYHKTVYVYSQPIVVPVVVPAEKLMQVPAGATLTLQAPNLGEAPGQVVLQMEKVAMASLVQDWKLDTVTATLPPMDLAAPVIAEILILRADGSLANGMKIELIPGVPGAAAAAPATGLDAASQAAAALGM